MSDNGNNGNGRLSIVMEQVEATLPKDDRPQMLAWLERTRNGHNGNGHNGHDLEVIVEVEKRESALDIAARDRRLPAKDLTHYEGSGSRLY